MITLVAVYLVLVLLLPLTVSVAVSLRALPAGRRCPHCATETLPLQARGLRTLSRLIPGQVERRWCLACGWEGIARVRRQAADVHMAPLFLVTPVTSTVSETSTRTLDVRWLNVDGRPWRVVLECWQRTDRCYGRLVFVDPAGRLWTDAMQSFSGSTPTDLLGQALSLPDRQLASRLREVTSE